MNSKILITGAILLGLTIPLGPRAAIAQVSAVQPTSSVVRESSMAIVGETQAFSQGGEITLLPGRNSVIDFRNGEVISSIQISDPTYVLFRPTAEIESGKATAIILRLSNGLNFENLSRSQTPNITIVTAKGTQTRVYTLEVRIKRGIQDPTKDKVGLAIVPDDQVPVPGGGIITSLGNASIEDIQRGLRVAIRRGFTPRTDPIVSRVEEVLARSRNGGSLQQLAQQSNVPIAILTRLGELGLQRRQQETQGDLRRRILGTQPDSR